MADTTALLDQLTGGDASAADRLLPLVYDHLRSIAASMMRDEHVGHTLQPTAIVHEAYIRLVDQSRVTWKSRAHFLSVSAMVIRRILVDHARTRRAQKRGGGWHRVTLMDAEQPAETVDVDMIAIDEAIERLSELNERQSQVVMLRFFGGLTAEETALVLDVSRTTVTDDWTIARAWLSRELSVG